MNNNFFYNAYINYIKIKNFKTDDILDFNDDTNHIIGIYDNRTKIWINGWAYINITKNKLVNEQLKKIKELLIYATNIENDMNSIYNNLEKTIIKSILINSKYYINEKKTQLDIILAIICYLLKAKVVYKNTSDDIHVYKIII